MGFRARVCDAGVRHRGAPLQRKRNPIYLCLQEIEEDIKRKEEKLNLTVLP